MTIYYLDSTLGGNDAVHWGLSERVKFLVLPPHEIRLEEVATVAIVLELTLGPSCHDAIVVI